MLYRKGEYNKFGYVTYNPTREQSVRQFFSRTSGQSMLSDKNVFGPVFLSCSPAPPTSTLAIIPFPAHVPLGL